MSIYRYKPTVGDLRQRVINIKDVSKGRIALFALIEMSFENEVSLEAIDKALYIAEN